ncbi:MAG: NAD(P)H-hydrate dehydratase [Bacteriovorax sp.]|nr:NAD(P)H-hydrate dehydratase [Rhizobacter sp.]
MQPVLPNENERPLFDADASRRIEALETARVPAHTLMGRAGEALARLGTAIAPHARRVWVAAGPGNNGGDGLEAAIHLLRQGRQVEVALVGDATALPPDAADALARAVAAGVSINPSTHFELDAGDIAIDALLGLGASRAPQGAIADSIRALNALACPVLAVDVPSGLHVGTGRPLGDACVVASHTLALLTLKPGLFTGAGRDHAGAIWFDALGADAVDHAACTEPSAWLAASPCSDRSAPKRRHAQHKGSFGDVAVVGGAPGMAGAALLAARAAHASGAGRVFVQLLQPAETAMGVDALRPELMFRAHWAGSTPEVLARSTVVCGCGGGEAVRDVLPRLLSLAQRLVLDADALNAVATDPVLATLLCARAARGLGTVLTPHPLEAARLLGATTSEVEADRLHAAQALAERFRCAVVLKGSGSIIAAPHRTPRINPTGNAALATGGTGDVLAGWLGGLWAQALAGIEPAEVATRAVAEHGAAAEPQPAGALRAGDLIEALYRRPQRMR